MAVTMATNARMFDRKLATSILANNMYQHQRRIRQETIDNYSRAMSKGNFAPVSSIMFATVKNADNRCINGQHTLHAIVKSGVPICLPTVQYNCDTEEERAQLYYRIDLQRKRGVSDSIRALELSEEWGLSPTQISYMVAALRFIKGNWGVEGHLPDKYNIDDILPLVKWWVPDMKEIYRCISPCGKTERNMTVRRSILSVALVTMHYQHDSASEFWRQYTQDDGLSRYDPRKTIRQWVLKNIRKTNSSLQPASDNEIARAVALAWNAYMDGRELRYTIVRDATKNIVISGTPYNGYQDPNFLPEWGFFEVDNNSERTIGIAL